MKQLSAGASSTYDGDDSAAADTELFCDLPECLAALTEKPNAIIELLGRRSQILHRGMTKPPRLKEELSDRPAAPAKSQELKT
jgi:hypothetical protein